MKRTNNFLSLVLVIGLMMSLGFLAGCKKPAPPASTPAATPITSMKPMANSDSLINVAQLKELIGKDNVVVVDYSEKSGTVIPGAIWIDRTQLVRELDGDRMSIQTKEVHEKILGENGISNETTIITYDDSNNLYATRFLWQLRAYGHKNVKLLNGGTKAWIAAGGSTDNKPANPKPAVIYKAINNVGSIRADLADVLDATHNSNWSLIDIRTQQEWDGGRVPGAIQFTYPTDIVNSDGTFKTVEEYEMLLRNIPKNTKIITYCMGGIRAASMLYVFTDFLGWPERVLNYDGSWWNYDWSKSTVEK